MQPEKVSTTTVVTADAPYVAELQALQRAIPVTRLVDYGMPLADAVQFHALAPAKNAWLNLAKGLAQSHAAKAEELMRQGCRTQASAEWEWAAASFNTAQLAFNFDVPDKVALYQRMIKCVADAASLSGELRRLELPGSAGQTLFGWQLSPERPVGAVAIFGGLSGWGVSYLGIARAMVRRGLAVVLCELPGQGETRMQSGLYLSAETLAAADLFVKACETLAGRVGAMGNSFGGLLAARIATQNAAVAACCINGALPRIPVPDFRTPREQMIAAFGVPEAQIGSVLDSLAFRPGEHTISCPTLVLEGGADPIVPVGGQAGFLTGNSDPASRTMTWEDGEHTLYNHAAERNEIVASWFRDQLERQAQ